MNLPSKIAGFRSRPINALIDFLGAEEDGDEAGGGGAPELQRHLAVHVVGRVKVDVHGGRWTRLTGGVEYSVPLTVDGEVTSASYADVKTLTASAAGVVILTLNSATAPTTLKASIVEAFPVDLVGKTIWPLAVVEWDAGTSTISRVEPLWTGGDVTDFGHVVPDTVSVEFDPADGDLQLNNFATAISAVAVGSTDLFAFKSVLNSDLEYATPTQIAGAVTWTGIDLAGAAWSAPHPWPENHSTLLDILAGTCGDNHDGGLTVGNYPYVSGREPGSGVGGREGNWFATGSDLADHTGAASVDVDDRQLQGGPWDITDATDITPGTAASGALQVTGGASIAKSLQALSFYLQGAYATNFWTAANFLVTASSTAYIKSPDSQLADADSSDYVKVVNGAISLHGAAINYGASDVAGRTITDWTSLGGVTGTNIIERTADATGHLVAGDRVLVIAAA